MLLDEGKKEFWSPRNEENKTMRNEVFGEEDEGQHNKSLHINREELKDNSKKTSKRKVGEYKMKGSNEWKTVKIACTA